MSYCVLEGGQFDDVDPVYWEGSQRRKPLSDLMGTLPDLGSVKGILDSRYLRTHKKNLTGSNALLKSKSARFFSSFYDISKSRGF